METRFSQYATKQDHQQLLHQLFDHTRQDQTERIVVATKSLEASRDEFAKKLHEETLAIAKAVAPRGAKCRDYWPTPRVHLEKFSGEGYRRKFSASTTFRD